MSEPLQTNCDVAVEEERAADSAPASASEERASEKRAADAAPEGALIEGAVPAPTPVIGGVSPLLFAAGGPAAADLGPSCPDIVGAPGEAAPNYDGWKGAPKIAEALVELAFGRVAAADNAIRVVASSASSPIARRILPECASLAERGVRCSILLQSEPREADEFAPLAALSKALGVPRLDDFVRVADFPGAQMCLEQAMIGDRFYWSGEPLARRRPTPLPAGSLVDLTRSNAAPAAARLRFAAAWRLAAEPSHEFCRRVAAAARAL